MRIDATVGALRLRNRWEKWVSYFEGVDSTGSYGNGPESLPAHLGIWINLQCVRYRNAYAQNVCVCMCSSSRYVMKWEKGIRISSASAADFSVSATGVYHPLFRSIIFSFSLSLSLSISLTDMAIRSQFFHLLRNQLRCNKFRVCDMIPSHQSTVVFSGVSAYCLWAEWNRFLMLCSQSLYVIGTILFFILRLSLHTQTLCVCFYASIYSSCQS